jgi:hypothetical protein
MPEKSRDTIMAEIRQAQKNEVIFAILMLDHPHSISFVLLRSLLRCCLGEKSSKLFRNRRSKDDPKAKY